MELARGFAHKQNVWRSAHVQKGKQRGRLWRGSQVSPFEHSQL